MLKKLKSNSFGAALPQAALWFRAALCAVCVLLVPVVASAATPPAPINVTAANSEQGGVLIAWERPTAGLVLTFAVYRYTVSGQAGYPIAANLSAEEYLDTTAPNGQAYFYAVRAVNADNELSTLSNEARLTVKDIVPPASPTAVTATSSYDGTVYISWRGPNEVVDSYILYRSSSPGIAGSRIKQVRTNSYVEYNLPGGQTFYYSVVAIDAAGNQSSESAQGSVLVTNENDQPLAVSSFAATATGRTGEISLQWTIPSNTNYAHARLYRTTLATAEGSLIADQVYGTGYVDQGLADGTEYFYTVQPVSRGGVAQQTSESVSASPYVYGASQSAPPPVMNARARDLGTARAIELSWSNPAIHTYQQVKIYRSTSRAERGTLVVSGLRATSYTDTSDITSDTRYYYTFVTVDTNGTETETPVVISGFATYALSGEGAGHDADGDGLSDDWERNNGFHPRVADLVDEDADEDGLTLAQEYAQNTNPWIADSDGDGYNDGTEVANGFNPNGNGRIVSVEQVQQRAQPGTFAYGVARLSSLSEEQSLAAQLRGELEGAFGSGRIPNPRSHWPTLVNSYIYGGYTAAEIAHTLRYGPGKVHPAIPAVTWRRTAEYSRR